MNNHSPLPPDQISSGNQVKSPEIDLPSRNSTSNDDLTSLVGILSDLKVAGDDTQPGSGENKDFTEFGISSSDFISRHKHLGETIEGSPIMMKKRLNDRATPSTFQAMQPLKSILNDHINTENKIPLYTNATSPLPVPPPVITSKVVPTPPIAILASPPMIKEHLGDIPAIPKLLVICSAASDEHDTGDHQENARRTALLCSLTQGGCLHRPSLKDSIEWMTYAEPSLSTTSSTSSTTTSSATLSGGLLLPSITDLLRVHDYDYLSYLEKKCAASSSTSSTSSSTSSFPAFYAPAGMLDTDTPLVAQSLTAAKRFCGAAMAAVDKVITGALSSSVSSSSSISSTSSSSSSSSSAAPYQRAFVIGRPPGHHAGPSGCVPSSTFWKVPYMTSSGFCLLNTVAVAAAYTRSHYGRQAMINQLQTQPVQQQQQPVQQPLQQPIQRRLLTRPPRIAIIDIDIHHGNGTEEIVRCLSPAYQSYLPLPSSWAPVQRPVAACYKPWLNEEDAQEVLFSSIHLYAGEDFYPGSGQEVVPAVAAASLAAGEVSNNSNNHSYNSLNNNHNNNNNIINICLTPLGPGPWDKKARAKLTSTKREDLCQKASQEFRKKVKELLLPRLASFSVDILFVSAGFDAHYDDAYHFLTEEDIHWVTSEMMTTCQESNPERFLGVISILEGGYSLSSNDAAGAAAGAAVGSSSGSASSSVSSTSSVNMYDKSAYVATSRTGGVGNGTKKRNSGDKFAAGAAAVPVAMTMHNRYGQTPGDGGLVKSVLAHTAALAGKKSWL